MRKQNPIKKFGPPKPRKQFGLRELKSNIPKIDQSKKSKNLIYLIAIAVVTGVANVGGTRIAEAFFDFAATWLLRLN